MTIADCLVQARLLGDHYQLAINSFADDFRRAPVELKQALVATPIAQGQWLEALLAAVVSYLCHEAGIPQPPWVEHVTSPAPHFVLPARSFEMRVRLMLESPPPFRNRRVFVPENYLSRA
jgi:hypothetical protein